MEISGFVDMAIDANKLTLCVGKTFFFFLFFFQPRSSFTNVPMWICVITFFYRKDMGCVHIVKHLTV